jgi:hypothetical protein
MSGLMHQNHYMMLVGDDNDMQAFMTRKGEVADITISVIDVSA